MKNILRLSLLLFLSFGWAIVNSSAQTIDVVNAGTLIYIQQDAVVSIGGSYTDNNSAPPVDGSSNALTLDAPMFLSGTLYVGGNIINNSGTSTKLIFEFENPLHTGKVILNGTSQTIGGSVGSYFPNLTLQMTGTLTLEQSLWIDNNLTLTSGKIDLASKSITLLNYGAITGETQTNNLYGSSGVVHSPLVSIIQNSSESNFRGMGFGYSMGLHNIEGVRVERLQNNASTYSVADNTHTLRVYKLTTTTAPLSDQLEFDQVTVSYHESELNSLSENNLALYVSNDNGATWRKVGIANPATNTVSSSIKVPLIGQYDGTTNPNNVNLFALAASTCVTNLPTASIKTSGVLATTNLNICEANDLNISIDAVPGGTYYQMSRTTDGNLNTVLAGAQTYSVPNIGHTDQGNYFSFVRHSSGCENTDVLYVDVKDKPDAFFTFVDNQTDNLTTCRRDLINFVDGSSTSDETTITGWNWSFGDVNNITSITQHPEFAYDQTSDTGLQQPTLIVTTNEGCVSLEYSKDIYISQLPSPSFFVQDGNGNDITSICEDINASFIDGSTYNNFDGSTSSLSYRYRFGDGNTSYVSDPVHAFLIHNTYTIWQKVTADATGCYDSISHSLIVKPEPIPSFTPEIAGSVISEACVGVDILFNNSTTMPDGTAVTYIWSFDGGNPDNIEVSPELEFTNHGVYDVILTALSTTHGCVEDDTVTITIHPPPAGDFSITDPDICLDEPAEFTNNSTIAYGTLTYQWAFGDATSSTSSSSVVTHNYHIPKLYNVKLTRTSDKGCSNAFSRTVTVHPTPVPMFSQLDECDGNNVQFYNMSVIQSDVISTYIWNFGDGASSLDEDPSHKYATYGQYDVTLTATSDFGCTANKTATVQIFQRPSFNLGALLVGCNTNYTIDPSMGTDLYIPSGTTYQWFNATNNNLGNGTTLDVTQQGIYKVTLTESHQCDSTFTLPVTLFLPAALGQDITSCDNLFLDAETQLPGEKSRALSTTYQWTKNGAPFSTAQTVNIVESGTYGVTITRTFGSGSCSSYDEVDVNIQLPLTASLPSEIIGCEGETLTIDAGLDADSFLWTNVDTGLPSGSTRTIDVTTSGRYKMVVTLGSCSSQVITNVVFTAPPSVSFTTTAEEWCENRTLTFKDYSFAEGVISSLLWDFGDGSTATQSEVGKLYAMPGTYQVSLTASTAQGCSNSYEQTIVVNQAPVAAFDVNDACEHETLTINNTRVPSNADVHWLFSDGTESTDPTPAKVFDKSGSFDITLAVNNNGCTSIITKSVTIHALPELDFGNEVTTCGSSLLLDAHNPGASYKWFDPAAPSTALATTQQYLVTSDASIGLEIIDNVGCTNTDISAIKLNTPVILDLGQDREVCDEGSLYAGYFPGASFTWSSGQNTEKIDVASSGNYAVTVTDQNGCTAYDDVNITVLETPSPTLEFFQAMCSNEQLVLNPQTDPSFSYAWSNGQSGPTITVSSAGTYKVIVSNGICSRSASTKVTMYAAPSPAFTANTVCAGTNTTFINESQGVGTLQYVWSLGDGTSSALKEPSKVYEIGGNYLVTLTAFDASNCHSEITKPVIVNKRPLASFTIANSCSNTPLDISNTTTYDGISPINYTWDFENGDTFNGKQPTYSYYTSNTYYIQLKAITDEGCTDDYFQPVFIGLTPSLTQWQSSIESCNPSVTLDAGNAGSTYLWSDNSTAQNVTANASGTYSVLITSPDGCTAMASSNVSLNSATLPQLNDNYAGCGSVLLDPTITAATYLWSNGAQTKTITATNTGEYWIQVVSDQLCISRDTTQVAIYEIPIFTLGNDFEKCEGQQATLTVSTSVPVTYQWSTGATTNSIDVTSTGRYSLRLTSDRGCEANDEVKVTFNPLPVLNFAADVTACGSYLLDAGNVGSTYLWSNGATSKSLTVTQTGLYSVTVTSAKKCSNQNQIDINILPLPTIWLGNDQVLCHGETTTLDAGDFNGTYNWSDNSTNRYLQVGSSGTYTVTLTDANGCSASDDINVTVRPGLGLDLGPDRLLCSNGGLFLSAGVNNVSYAWGSNTGFTAITKEIKPTQAGQYWVSIKDSNNCTATDTVKVTPTTENITASFLVPSIVNRGDIVHFAMLTEPQPTSVSWDFGDGGRSTEINPSHFYFKVGDFKPTLVVYNGVCADTLTKLITVREGRSVVDPPVQLPELVEILNASQFPNPTIGIVKVDLELSTEADVWIALISIKGTAVAEKRKKTTTETFEFDITSEANGIYFVRIVVDKNMRVLKVLKAEHH